MLLQEIASASTVKRFALDLQAILLDRCDLLSIDIQAVPDVTKLLEAHYSKHTTLTGIMLKLSLQGRNLKGNCLLAANTRNDSISIFDDQLEESGFEYVGRADTAHELSPKALSTLLGNFIIEQGDRQGDWQTKALKSAIDNNKLIEYDDELYEISGAANYKKLELGAPIIFLCMQSANSLILTVRSYTSRTTRAKQPMTYDEAVAQSETGEQILLIGVEEQIGEIFSFDCAKFGLEQKGTPRTGKYKPYLLKKL